MTTASDSARPRTGFGRPRPVRVQAGAEALARAGQLVRGRLQLHLALHRHLHPVRAGPDHDRRGVHLDLAGGGGGPVPGRAQLRRGVQPLPGGGVGVPVDQVPGHRTYSWFTGWIYLFAGILTVTAVVATMPIALIPALNGLGWHSLNAASLHTQLVVALIILVIITVLNIYGVRLVAVINNTGGVRDPRHVRVRDRAADLPQPPGLQGGHQQRRPARRGELVPGRDVHEPVRHLQVRHRLDPGRGDPGPPPGRAQGRGSTGDRRVHHRRGVPARHADGHPEPEQGDQPGTDPGYDIEANFSTGLATVYLLVVSVAIFVCCLSIMAATIRLCFGMSRDNQLPFWGCGPGSPTLHTRCGPAS